MAIPVERKCGNCRGWDSTNDLAGFCETVVQHVTRGPSALRMNKNNCCTYFHASDEAIQEAYEARVDAEERLPSYYPAPAPERRMPALFEIMGEVMGYSHPSQARR